MPSPDGIRFLADSHRHAQYCPFPQTNPIKFQQSGLWKISSFYLDPNGSYVSEADVQIEFFSVHLVPKGDLNTPT